MAVSDRAQVRTTRVSSWCCVDARTFHRSCFGCVANITHGLCNCTGGIHIVAGICQQTRYLARIWLIFTYRTRCRSDRAGCVNIGTGGRRDTAHGTGGWLVITCRASSLGHGSSRIYIVTGCCGVATYGTSNRSGNCLPGREFALLRPRRLHNNPGRHPHSRCRCHIDRQEH